MDVRAWTIIALLAALLLVPHAVAQEPGDRVDALDRLMRERWQAYHREQILRDQALITAREAINGRLEQMNELRAQINSERGRYLDRQSFDLYKDATQKETSALAERISSLEVRLTTKSGPDRREDKRRRRGAPALFRCAGALPSDGAYVVRDSGWGSGAGVAQRG